MIFHEGFDIFQSKSAASVHLRPISSHFPLLSAVHVSQEAFQQSVKQYYGSEAGLSPQVPSTSPSVGGTLIPCLERAPAA